jgi:hypothetical protein
MISFDLVSCFLMNRLEILTRGVISDPELNFDINWPTFDNFDIAWPTLFLLNDLKSGPGVQFLMLNCILISADLFLILLTLFDLLSCFLV